MDKLSYIIGAIGLLIILFFSWMWFMPTGGTIVNISGVKIKVEEARSEAGRVKGLSGHKSLSKDRGLLLVFERSDRHAIWMKDMKFPLDVIWIDKDKIVHLEKNISNPREGVSDQGLPVYIPPTPADNVLELNAGFIEKHNIKIGDTALILRSR